MKIALLTAVALASVSLFGCQKSSRMGNAADLPAKWSTANPKSWQVQGLPELSKDQLTVMQRRLSEEREGQYYSFFGTYNPTTLQYISTTSAGLDEAFLNMKYSSKVIIRDLSPNMEGVSSTYIENEANFAVIKDIEDRMLEDDWSRALLTDKPSSLSTVPIVQD
jgi:hypothetical protein